MSEYHYIATDLLILSLSKILVQWAVSIAKFTKLSQTLDSIATLPNTFLYENNQADPLKHSIKKEENGQS